MEWGECPCEVDIADTAVITPLHKDLESISHDDVAGCYRADLVEVDDVSAIRTAELPRAQAFKLLQKRRQRLLRLLEHTLPGMHDAMVS